MRLPGGAKLIAYERVDEELGVAHGGCEGLGDLVILVAFGAMGDPWRASWPTGVDLQLHIRKTQTYSREERGAYPTDGSILAARRTPSKAA